VDVEIELVVVEGLFVVVEGRIVVVEGLKGDVSTGDSPVFD
jgi:hypothetical protein